MSLHIHHQRRHWTPQGGLCWDGSGPTASQASECEDGSARARTHAVSKLRFRCGSVACFSSRLRLLFQTTASFPVSWAFLPFPRTFCSFWLRTSLFQHCLLCTLAASSKDEMKKSGVCFDKPIGRGRGLAYRGRDLSCVDALPVLCSALSVCWSDLSSTSKNTLPSGKTVPEENFPIWLCTERSEILSDTTLVTHCIVSQMIYSRGHSVDLQISTRQHFQDVACWAPGLWLTGEVCLFCLVPNQQTSRFPSRFKFISSACLFPPIIA